MPKIILAECKQEVSTFNPVPSEYEDFRIEQGAKMLPYFRGVGQEISGALTVFDQDDSIELVPTFGAKANTSGGVLSASGWDRLSGSLLEALTGHVDVDGVYFSLHGAMQAENENDPEGFLLQEARNLLGDQVPIVISLDLHGILTDRMFEHSDAIVTYHTYPHVDFVETGQRAATVLSRILNDGVQPVTARVKIPALVRGNEMITESGAVSACIELSKEIEASDAGLSAGVMWGNPFTDVPELRTNSVVVMDADAEAAKSYALQLADKFWAHHEKMQVPLTSLEESILIASTVETGTVVLMDAADATSSGASGDSNAILCELVRQGYPGRALIPVVDPAAVRAAFEAGVGATIETSVGGAFDTERYQPLNVTGRVRMLSDGRFKSESFGWDWDSGDTAVLEVDNVTLVVGTRPVSLFDRSWFYANGQDPQQFDLVVVKSPHCEPHMFADWCASLIDVDAPGATSANLHSLGHTICERPMFPLDEIKDYQPVADLFSRE
ncbi:MAG: microcystin degradation protein MlrC [Gemmatimonadetes bacterium]|nr:microcystin degradation protein MlrC [Gemmatimonadota bacterium]